MKPLALQLGEIPLVQWFHVVANFPSRGGFEIESHLTSPFPSDRSYYLVSFFGNFNFLLLL